jgi:hypothetical protein
MPLVQIKIDQAGKPAGLPGIAREDLDISVDVTLSAVGGPFTAYRWSLVDPALEFENDALATSAIISPTTSSTLLSPIDVSGTYLVKLEIDSGSGLGATADDVSTLTFYAGLPLSVYPDELPKRIPAAREYTEHNVPNAAYPTGNRIGWAYVVGQWLKGVVRRLYRIGPRAGIRISTASAGPTVTTVRAFYMTTSFDGTKYTCTIAPPYPNAFYGVVVTPHESTDYGHPASYAVTILSSSQFEIRFYDAADVVTGADFTALAVLGDD